MFALNQNVSRLLQLAVVFLFVFLYLIALSRKGFSQGLVESPSGTRPDLPTFEAPKREKGTILPPARMATNKDTSGIRGGITVFIREIVVKGSTILSQKDLDDITRQFVNREMDIEDLRNLRDQLTLVYVNRGYISSGARIPEQSLEAGVLQIEIVEGKLGDVKVETDGRFKEEVIRRKILRGGLDPVNILEIEERLQLLQRDPLTRLVEAQLIPGDDRGESILNLKLYEEPPYWAKFEVSNYQSSTIGAWRALAELEAYNLVGFGDETGTRFQLTEGLWEVAAKVEVPINASGSTLVMHARTAESEIVEDPFDELDIDSTTQTYSLTLEHPMVRSIKNKVKLFLLGEWRRSKSFLDGSGFSFIEGPDEGEAEIAVLRSGFDWVYRGGDHVFAARSTFSLGLDAFGATSANGKIPDGQFFTWLGQFQWARRLRYPDSQFIIRVDGQVSDSALLGLEQFAMGGHGTVRGYRENTLVRDNGVIVSLELRFPILQSSTQSGTLEATPFFDWGHSWNTDRGEIGPETLVGWGLGLRYSLRENLQANIYWAEDLLVIKNSGEYDFQDDGIHLSLTWEFQ